MFLIIHFFNSAILCISKWKDLKVMLDLCVAEFDLKEVYMGLKNHLLSKKMITKKTLLKKYGFKIAFYSDIMLELYKQGRSLKWLHRVVNENGTILPIFHSLKMVNNNLNMSKIN